MGASIKQKETFGGAKVHHFGPPLPPETPTAINVHISFEEALKLHLSLGQLLAKLNSYNRATRAGKASAANLCIYTQTRRITVNEGYAGE